MIETGAGTNNIFRKVDQIQFSDIQHQAHGYFGLRSFVNVVNILPKPLVVSDLLKLFTSAQEVKKFNDRVCSDMIAKAIEVSIKNISLKKLGIDRGGYEWNDSGGLISNGGLTMFYFLFKSINQYTRIGVSNLNDEIVKTNLAKFVNNVKYLLI